MPGAIWSSSEMDTLRKFSLVPNDDLCESYEMTPTEPTRGELEELISSLRDEINRLKEEIRQIRRETNEAPPHYL